MRFEETQISDSSLLSAYATSVESSKVTTNRISLYLAKFQLQ